MPTPPASPTPAQALLACLEHNSRTFYLVLDLHGVVRSANQSALAAAGCTLEEMLGRCFWEVPWWYHDTGQAGKIRAAVALAARGEAAAFETAHRAQGGGLLEVDITIYPLCDDSGAVLCLVAEGHDVTLRKRAERERQHGDERFHRLFNLNKLPMLLIDPDSGRLVNVNHAAADFYGYPIELLRQLSITDINTLDAADVERELHLARNEGRDYWHFRHRLASGAIRDVAVHSGPVEIESRTLLLSTILDVTSLHDSERMLDITQRVARIGSWRLHFADNGFFCSGEMRRMFNLAPQGCIELEDVISLFDPADLQAFRAAFARAPQPGIVIDHECAINATGVQKWVRIIAETHFQDGVPSMVVGTVQDITEKFVQEERLRRAKDAAEHANRAKSEFLSRMSHELRTPLNAILGFAQLMTLDSAGAAPQQNDNVEPILKAGWHLLALIKDVLDVAKIESGRLDLHLQSTAITEVLAEAVGLVNVEATKRGIAIINQLSAAPRYKVLADRKRLLQVFTNLLNNAVKYNRDNGEVRIKMSANQGLVRIAIADTGLGLSATQQSQLFQPFNRLGAEITAVEGTGIGLVICKHLIEAMHGVIGVSSRESEGAEFWIELPLTDSDSPAADESPVTVPHSPGANVEVSILYAEDNRVNVELMKRIFARFPRLRLLIAESGSKCLELAATEHPAILLLDTHLPDMTGFDVAQLLASDAVTRTIPIIGISASAMPEEVERSRALGFKAYLTKPFDVPQLLAIVAALLQPSEVAEVSGN